MAQVMERDDQDGPYDGPFDAVVSTTEKYHTEVPVPNTNTTFAVYAPTEGANLPVVLFQSGYGSHSGGHQFLLEKVAAQGFIVIAPDRADDTRCGCCGILGFLNTTSCAGLSVDGSHLAMALEYAKNKENKWMDRADPERVIMSGFSMGGQEVVHAAARFPQETKAIVVVSGSMLLPLAHIIGWNCCCAPCNPGSPIPCCSDTPVGMCGISGAVKAWQVPSLFITAEYDATKAGMDRGADIAPNSTLVTFKDSALDLANPTTRATTSWGPFLALGGCYGTPFFGMPRHFALANEEKDVSAVPVGQFLRKHFYGGPDMEASDLMWNGQLNAKAPNKCCAPFPLFRSCCDM